MRTALQKVREAPESTKARILATAEEVFAAKGFAGASTREIAAKARVNISSLHYHWESKETLYLAVFQNVYERILDLVRTTIPGQVDGSKSARSVIEKSMGAVFDFFADHPTIPKLLVHRLLETDQNQVAVERDVLVPAWKVFAEWFRGYRGRTLTDVEAQLFMLTVNSVVLLFLLDSRHFKSVLGGSVHEPALRRRLRAYTIDLVQKLLR